MQVLVIIGMLWLPESPEFFFAKGRFDESKEVLMYMARFNGRQIEEENICFDNIEEHDDDKNNSKNDVSYTSSINDIV